MYHFSCNAHEFDVCNIAAMCLAAVALLSYQMRFIWLLFFTRDDRIHAMLSIRVMRNWIEKLFLRQSIDSVTLGIQTLRNLIIVAVFIGGSTLNFSIDLLLTLTPRSPIANVAILWVASCMLCSFICWTQVVRAAVHLGYVLYALDIAGDSDDVGEVKDNIASTQEFDGNVHMSALNMRSDPRLISCRRFTKWTSVFFS